MRICGKALLLFCLFHAIVLTWAFPGEWWRPGMVLGAVAILWIFQILFQRGGGKSGDWL